METFTAAFTRRQQHTQHAPRGSKCDKLVTRNMTVRHITQFLFTLIFCVITSDVIADGKYCEKGYEMFDGLCYLYQNMTRTWNSAVSYCRDTESASLTNAKDSSQQEHLLNLSLSYINTDSEGAGWLGLMKTENTGLNPWWIADVSSLDIVSWAPFANETNTTYYCNVVLTSDGLWNTKTCSSSFRAGFWCMKSPPCVDFTTSEACDLRTTTTTSTTTTSTTSTTTSTTSTSSTTSTTTTTPLPTTTSTIATTTTTLVPLVSTPHLNTSTAGLSVSTTVSSSTAANKKPLVGVYVGASLGGLLLLVALLILLLCMRKKKRILERETQHNSDKMDVMGTTDGTSKIDEVKVFQHTQSSSQTPVADVNESNHQSADPDFLNNHSVVERSLNSTDTSLHLPVPVTDSAAVVNPTGASMSNKDGNHGNAPLNNNSAAQLSTSVRSGEEKQVVSSGGHMIFTEAGKARSLHLECVPEETGGVERARTAPDVLAARSHGWNVEGARIGSTCAVLPNIQNTAESASFTIAWSDKEGAGNEAMRSFPVTPHLGSLPVTEHNRHSGRRQGPGSYRWGKARVTDLNNLKLPATNQDDSKAMAAAARRLMELQRLEHLKRLQMGIEFMGGKSPYLEDQSMKKEQLQLPYIKGNNLPNETTN